jgi:ring-1,2-phenylacetyl-CoA epoxidase subunit PaaE
VPQFHPLQLLSRDAIATDAFRLAFRVPAELRDEFRFKPGQHLTVRATLDGKLLQRSYSIVSCAGEPLAIGVRVQGVMSRHLAAGLRVGESIEVMKPYGRFTTSIDADASRSYLALAAGSGITPILSIADAVLAGEPHSRFRLVYGNRDIEHTMFLPEVLALKDRYLSRFALHFVMSREPQDTPLFNGRLDAARLRELAARVFDVQAVDEFLICGPGSMVSELSLALRELGVQGQIRAERFTAARDASPETLPDTSPNASPDAGHLSESDRARATSQNPDADTTAVEVMVQMDGRRRSFAMPATGRTVLEAAEAAGLELPFSCRDGICATCRAKVVDGQVRMTRSQGLEAWEVEAGFVLCCQAHPLTPRLTLSFDEK